MGGQRRKTDTTAAPESHGLSAGLPGAGGPTDSVRGHQQVVMKHVLDQDLRMDLAGEAENLTAFDHPRGNACLVQIYFAVLNIESTSTRNGAD